MYKRQAPIPAAVASGEGDVTAAAAPPAVQVIAALSVPPPMGEMDVVIPPPARLPRAKEASLPPPRSASISSANLAAVLSPPCLLYTSRCV